MAFKSHYMTLNATNGFQIYHLVFYFNPPYIAFNFKIAHLTAIFDFL